MYRPDVLDLRGVDPRASIRIPMEPGTLVLTKSGEIFEAGNHFVVAPNNRAYRWCGKTRRWHPFDPIRGRRRDGKARKELPVGTELGTTKEGKPRRIPYPQKRKKRSDYMKVYVRTAERKKRHHVRLDKEITDAKRRLEKVSEELEKAERTKELIAKTPSSKEQREAILSLFKEMDFSAIEELIKMVKFQEMPVREKTAILKVLAEFETPKPRSSVADDKRDGGTVLQVVDFSGTGTDDLMSGGAGPKDVEDEEYEEFEDETT